MSCLNYLNSFRISWRTSVIVLIEPLAWNGSLHLCIRCCHTKFLTKIYSALGHSRWGGKKGSLFSSNPLVYLGCHHLPLQVKMTVWLGGWKWFLGQFGIKLSFQGLRIKAQQWTHCFLGPWEPYPSSFIRQLFLPMLAPWKFYCHLTSTLPRSKYSSVKML